jgi:hypothetical protein
MWCAEMEAYVPLDYGIECGSCGKKLRIGRVRNNTKPDIELARDMWMCSEGGHKSYYSQSSLIEFDAAESQGFAVIAPLQTRAARS